LADAPETIFTQAIDGELTAGSALRTVLAPGTLSVREQDSIIQRLKQAVGGGSITDALIDIATDPFTLLFFATSALGLSAIEQAAGKGKRVVGRLGGKVVETGLFDVATKYHPFVRENAGFLQTLGLASPLQSLRGTGIGAASFQALDDMAAFIRRRADELGPALEEARRALGVNTLDYTNPALNVEQADRVRKAMTALYLDLAGMARPGAQELIHSLTADGRLKQIAKDVPQLANRAVVEQTLRESGLVTLRDALRGSFTNTLREVFSDEDALLRVFRGIKDPVITSRSDPVLGTELIGSLLGDTLNRVREAEVSFDEFRGIVGRILKGLEDNSISFFPRNTRLGYDITTGKTLTGDQVRRLVQDKIKLTPGGSAVLRSSASPVFHPDDLKYIEETFGATADLEKAKGRVLAEIEKAAQEDRNFVLFQTINPAKAVPKYIQENSRTFALFTRTPGDDVFAAQIRSKAAVEEAKRRGLRVGTFGFERGRRGAAGFDEVFSEVQPDRAPIGGFSVADAIRRDFELLQDPHARRVVTDVVVPRLMGRLSLEHATTIAAFHTGRQTLDALVSTDAFQALKRTGGVAERLVSRLERLARGPIDEDSVKGLPSRFAASLIYKSALGANLQSVAKNALQPFQLATVFGGVSNVVKAYSSALSEFGTYFKERFRRFGFRPITNIERAQIGREAFEFFDEIGAGQEALELLDSIAFTGPKGFSALTRPSGVRDELLSLNFLLAPFQTVEILNRNVAAHAIRIARGVEQGAAKLGKAPPGFRTEVREFVNETQFGATFLNTPLIFQPALGTQRVTPQFLANQVFRQFLQFPLRSFTGVAITSPTLAGRESRLLGMATDIIRGIGVSSIYISLARNLLNADLRDQGFTEITLEFPGLLFGAEGRGIAPPITGVLKDFAGIVTDTDVRLSKRLGRAASRVLPAGIALDRLADVLPDQEQSLVPILAPLQDTFADYSQRTEDGRIPIFDARTGALLGFEDAATLALGGLGLDFGRLRERRNQVRRLFQQRDTANQLKRAYLREVSIGRIDKANQIARDFERRFGVPMQISRERLRSFERQLTTTGLERTIKSLPPELRRALGVEDPPPTALPIQSGQPADQRGGANTAAVRDAVGGGRNLLPREAVAQEPGFQPFSANVPFDTF